MNCPEEPDPQRQNDWWSLRAGRDAEEASGFWESGKCSGMRQWWWLYNSEHTKNQQTVCFKRVNYMVQELYLDTAIIENKERGL